MPLRRILALSLVLAMGWEAVPALAGVTPCCPHRTGKARVVRAGGLGLSATDGGTAVVEACEACGAWEVCAMDLESAGAGMQTMPLRNGVMSVYTAGTPDGVRVIRNALTRYVEHLVALTMTGDAVRLCPHCRLMRGAAASGRLAREVVPVEGGAMLLMTTPDPALMQLLRTEAGIEPAPRTRR